MVNLQVEYGESTILPCNGSAYLEEEGSVHWEAMGEDVAILQGGELRQGDKFKGRVQLPSEEKLREGDWSVVLQHTMLTDTDMYECIWQGKKAISIVWLTIMAPHVEHFLEVPVGDVVVLACYIQISRSQSPNDLQVWWTRNGSTIVSIEKEALFYTAVVSNSEDISRIDLFVDTKEAFHLYITRTMMSDNGEYRCLYKTRDSDDPRPGIPESITLTVLETNPTDTVFHPEETTTGTEDLLIIPWTEEVTDVETTESPLDLIPVLLEDSTQAIKESHAMEGFKENSFPDEGTPEISSESLQWDTLPWIRIGLIAGVLLVTAVVLCILGALQKM
ncbi:uncharacterized protein LOC122872316 isoform X2 [Siniperca chuatsi]|nr:uncharacterized protein LOC122872316 isoform X2 [Siniperca chuatsi]